MDDSDDDYVESVTGDLGPRRRLARRRQEKTDKSEPEAEHQTASYAWEDPYHRSWDVVQEDSGGSLEGAVAGMVADAKRRRVMRDKKPVQRGIIRNLVMVLDMSFAMQDSDMRPNRYQVMLNYAIDFVTEFFGQNPISQLAIVAMEDGLAKLLSPLDGNPQAHIDVLQAARKQYPAGLPSLQNALEMAKAVLQHVPSHTTKEVLLVFGALLSNDPGDINKTIDELVKNKIRVRVIGLAAQVAVCKQLSLATNFGDPNAYNVVLNESHFKQLMMEITTPLSVSAVNASSASALVLMGFPSRITSPHPIFCADGKLVKTSYECPRCLARVSSLPMACPVCSLTLILSTHLARSYHHLFPLQMFKVHDVQTNPGGPESGAGADQNCFACLAPIGVQRLECPKCHKSFCVDCDVFCHETLHSCPGCEAAPAISVASA